MIFEREGSNPIFAPDGEALLFNDRSGLHKWNIELDQEAPTKRNEFRFARAFRISPDGQTFATRFEDSDSGQMGLQIKSSETGENISTIYDYDLGGRYAQLEFSPTNPNLIAFVNYDSVSFPGFSAYIALWDIQANSITHRLSGYDSPLTSLNFSEDGRFLVTSEEADYETNESYIRLWNVEDGSQVAISPTYVDDDIYEARFSPDGTKLVSIHSDGVARIWRASDLELIQEIGQGNVDAQFSANGALVVTGSNRGRLSLWSIDTETLASNEIVSLQTDSLPLIQVAGDSTLSVIGFATGYYYDSEEDGYMHTIQIWNWLTGEVTVLYEDETNRVEEIAINPQGTILAAVLRDGVRVRLWNVETGEPLSQILTGATDYIRTLQFNSDGHLLASGGCGRRDVEGQCDLGEINVWNVDAGERILGPIHAHTSVVTALQFSPDEAKLISGSGGAIFYGSFDDYSIARWDMKTGTTLRAPATGHQGGISVLLYDNEGEFIFSGSGNPVYGYDSSIRAWNASLRRTVAVYDDNASPVEDLALVDVDDGSMLISIHEDGTLRFWNDP
jgi:WD40 repeat protein